MKQIFDIIYFLSNQKNIQSTSYSHTQFCNFTYNKVNKTIFSHMSQHPSSSIKINKSTTDRDSIKQNKRYSFNEIQNKRLISLSSMKRKKLSQIQRKRVKTDTSVDNELERSLIKSPRRIKNREFHMKELSIQSSSIMSKREEMLSVVQMVTDPFLNGRINHQRTNVYERMKQQTNTVVFLQKVQEFQQSFLSFIYKRNYQQGTKILINLLNYAIDFKLINSFSHSFKILGDFSLEYQNISEALFYYIQGWKCSFKTRKIHLLIEIFIKIAHCSNQLLLYEESIKILKKALEFAWFYELVPLQLRVYDEIGKTYYLLGNVPTAKNYHKRYIFAITQPKTTPSRLFSKESLVYNVQQQKQITSLNLLFLLSLNAPIKTLKELPQMNLTGDSFRSHYVRDMKYFYNFQPAKKLVSNFFKLKIFESQITDLHFDEGDWTELIRKNKYLTYDIKRNKYLKSKGIDFLKYSVSKPKQTISKDARKDSIHMDEWYSSLVKEVKRNTKIHNKLILNKIQVRDQDKPKQVKMSKIRSIYNQFFDYIQNS